MDERGQIEFRRLVAPLPTGRVRVTIMVWQIGGDGRQLLGKIIQVRGGWRFLPAGGAGADRTGTAGKVWATAEECKRSVQSAYDDNNQGKSK